MRKALIFACDKNFLPYTIFAVRRIREVEPDLDCDICVCSNTITKDDYPFAAEGILFHSIDLEPVDKLKTTSRFPVSTYTRLLLADYFHSDYDRILYLDGDTFLRKSGICKLLAIEMDGHAIAAALDAQNIIVEKDPAHSGFPDLDYQNTLGMKGAKYLNSGVLLIDVDEFRRQNVFARVVEFARENPEKLRFADQSAINATLLGDWKQFSCRWNFQRVADIELIETAYDPVLLHFCGPKPWEDTNHDWPNSYRDIYVSFLSKEFPEFRIKRKLEIIPKYTWRKKVQQYRKRNQMLKKYAHFEADCEI